MTSPRRPTPEQPVHKTRPFRSRRPPRAKAIALLAAVAVSVFSVVMIQAGRQRTTVEHVRELGGYVARASERRGHLYRPPAWYQFLFGEEFMNAVIAVRLAETNANDDDLVYVARLKRLEFLDLTDTRIGDNGLSHVSRLKHLKVLALTGTLVSDAGLTELLSCVDLRALSLEETNVTNDGLETLGNLENLQWLNLSGTRITDIGLPRLAGCRRLEVLVLEGCTVSNEGVAALTAALPQVEVYEGEDRRPLFWPLLQNADS